MLKSEPHNRSQSWFGKGRSPERSGWAMREKDKENLSSVKEIQSPKESNVFSVWEKLNRKNESLSTYKIFCYGIPQGTVDLSLTEPYCESVPWVYTTPHHRAALCSRERGGNAYAVETNCFLRMPSGSLCRVLTSAMELTCLQSGKKRLTGVYL